MCPRNTKSSCRRNFSVHLDHTCKAGETPLIHLRIRKKTSGCRGRMLLPTWTRGPWAPTRRCTAPCLRAKSLGPGIHPKIPLRTDMLPGPSGASKTALCGLCPAPHCRLSLHLLHLLPQVCEPRTLRVITSLHALPARPGSASSRKQRTLSPTYSTLDTYFPERLMGLISSVPRDTQETIVGTVGTQALSRRHTVDGRRQSSRFSGH